MSIDKSAILKAVRAQPDKLSKREIAKILGLRGDQRRDLRIALSELVEDNKLIKGERNAYREPNAMPDVNMLDIIAIDEHGDMVGVPSRWEGTGEAPRFLVIETGAKSGKASERKSAKLGVGGKALCKLNAKNMTAKVITVIGKSKGRQLGVIIGGQRGFRLKPVSKRSRDDYVLERASQTVKGRAVQDKDLVLFESVEQRRRAGFKLARIIEHISSVDDPKAASLISLHEHGIPMGFDQDVLKQADAAIMPKIGGPREDLRDIPLLTIDPDDAKDFDDAICAIKTDTGWEVWVAIADVSAFVTPGSPLDKAAYTRGNSVYLPDRVEPMLPHALSSNLCSLRPLEERACMAVRMKFDERGNKTGHVFKRGIMKSKARLTYAQAQAGFEGEPGDAALPVQDSLDSLYTFYKILRDARARRAPLEIDMPERRVRVGDDGSVTSIEVRARFDAHKLVEEFMIQANVAAAQALGEKGMDVIYRVHEPPSQDKLLGLADFLPVLGLKWTAGEKATTSRFNHLLGKAREKELSEVVGMAVLRTQSQAIYTPKNGGHFGLNLTQYAHFTSPIRRYADLVVHRALISAYGLGDDGQSAREKSKLPEIGQHISTTERRAMAAERDAKDRYIAAYLSDRVGAKFPARINGVTKFGLFVTLDETGADGLVPVRNLGHEYYVFDEKSRSLIGKESGGTYKFGARVTVRLVEAVPVTGGLTFEMLSKPEPGKRPEGQAGYQGRSNRQGGRKSGSHKRRRR
ncbi:MAG: ribonuclease R [Robiginitomaculum sp.]